MHSALITSFPYGEQKGGRQQEGDPGERATYVSALVARTAATPLPAMPPPSPVQVEQHLHLRVRPTLWPTSPGQPYTNSLPGTPAAEPGHCWAIPRSRPENEQGVGAGKGASGQTQNTCAISAGDSNSCGASVHFPVFPRQRRWRRRGRARRGGAGRGGAGRTGEEGRAGRSPSAALCGWAGALPPNACVEMPRCRSGRSLGENWRREDPLGRGTGWGLRLDQPGWEGVCFYLAIYRSALVEPLWDFNVSIKQQEGRLLSA